MRQGPIYNQRSIELDENDDYVLRVPLELVEDFSNYNFVNWRDDGNGTFTLIPYNEIE